jgi:hypothetical protein
MRQDERQTMYSSKGGLHGNGALQAFGDNARMRVSVGLVDG